MEKSTNQARLPHAIIALNATESEIDEKEWNCDYATQNLMFAIKEIIDRDPRCKLLANKWRAHGKAILNTQDLLRCYYSSIKVVRIPRKERDMLVDRQVNKLYNEIITCCDQSYRSKQETHELLNIDEFQQYLDSALDHFSQDIDSSFDFMKAGVSLNPIPSGLKDNILKLSIRA